MVSQVLTAQQPPSSSSQPGPAHTTSLDYSSSMPSPILLGQSDFISLREGGSLYIDKSRFVSQVLTTPAQVMLFPAPRRFGKTLALSMLHAFFEVGPDRSALFSDLGVWQDMAARAHTQRYPVIKLTFKDLKQKTWGDAKREIRSVLAREVGRHAKALGDLRLEESTRENLAAWQRGEGESTAVLLDLCEALALHHGQKVILLIDEYDAGLLSAWEHGYFEEAIAFFRSLMSSGLKDNPFLFKGVLTGILRVVRESMFSGLNNVRVYSLLHPRPAEPFGFTEAEVEALLTAFGRGSESEEVRRWYNGYRFGETTVYNPWSILCFLSEPGLAPQPWWLNTSENALMWSLLLENTDLGAEIATLIGGGSIEREIDENVALRDLRGDHMWALFLFSGYLRADAVRIEDGATFVTLSIPNREVRTVWTGTFRDWLKARAGALDPLHEAILTGDAAATERILSGMLLRHVSAHDVADDQDEAFYHASVLGLLVSLEKTHHVHSNREVGRGRADLQIIPKRPGGPGVVLEFKRRQGRKKLATIAAEALAQIHDRVYTTALEAAGASPIHQLGIAFSGKDVVVRGE